MFHSLIQLLYSFVLKSGDWLDHSKIFYCFFPDEAYCCVDSVFWVIVMFHDEVPAI